MGMNDTELYFAYGSNLDEAQMHQRCPGAVVVGPATLPGYRLTFTGESRKWGGAVATVVPDEAGKVPGLLYACTDRHLASLDTAEGHRIPGAYRRCTLRVLTDDGRKVDAVAYVKPVTEGEGTPPDAYLRLIRGAYQRRNFDLGALPE
jgi:gamma-glutamylcyclotransferase